MIIFGLSTRALEISARSLDFVADSTSQVAANIANATTPGYKSVSSDFASVMAQALKTKEEGGVVKTDPRHLPDAALGRLKPTQREETASKNIDGNTVNMETEVTRLTELDLQFSAYSNIAGKEIGTLKSAISLTAQ